jgi:hypothetical protein
MHRMRDETRNGGRMEQPTLCSPDRICQGDSELGVVLQQLIEAHGISAVKQVLRSIEAANQAENTRSRGRPPGPAIDDWPALQDAAAIWRQQGGGPVWPALTAVAKSLRGEPQSNARRLLSRVLKTGPGVRKDFDRAGIGDFRSAAFHRRFSRALCRAGPRYADAALRAMANLYLNHPKATPAFRQLIRCPLTLEDIAILIQPSPEAKIFPFHLINQDSDYLLYLGTIKFDQPRPPPIALENAIRFEDLIIVSQSRSVDVKISQDLPSGKPVFFDLIAYNSVNYLIPRQLIALDEV